MGLYKFHYNFFETSHKMLKKGNFCLMLINNKHMNKCT